MPNPASDIVGWLSRTYAPMYNKGNFTAAHSAARIFEGVGPTQALSSCADVIADCGTDQQYEGYGGQQAGLKKPLRRLG